MGRRIAPIAWKLLALITLCGAAGLVDRLALPDAVPSGLGQMVYRARVVARAGLMRKDDLLVEPMAGPKRGQMVVAAKPSTAATDLSGRVVFVEFRADGSAAICGIARDRSLLWLTAALVGLVALVAGGAAWRLLSVLFAGLAALIGILVPCLAGGVEPLLAALLTGTAFLAAAALLIGQGGRRAGAILAGSAGGLATAAVLSVLAVRAARLTGVYSALTTSLWFSPATEGLDFRQLLIAGMLVGTLGIILDLAAAIASAVHEVSLANPALQSEVSLQDPRLHLPQRNRLPAIASPSSC